MTRLLDFDTGVSFWARPKCIFWHRFPTLLRVTTGSRVRACVRGDKSDAILAKKTTGLDCLLLS